jgi:Sulfotransferase domain
MAPSATGRLPDFFIVGHPKCGTTALYEMLAAHPEVYMSEVKEPRYFASDLPSPYQPRSLGGRDETYEDYLSLFAGARPEQRIGEGSTAYIWSQTAAGLIARAQPTARIIAILREPASFLRSLHLQLLQHKSEEVASLREAIELEPRRRAGEALTKINEAWPQVLMYTDRVRYVEQLRRYREAFPAEQVLVLLYDDFRADNDATVRSVQRFLGIEELGANEISRANPSVQRRVGVDNALHSAFFGGGPALRTVRRGARVLAPERVRRGAFQVLRRNLVFANPQAPDEQLMGELRRRFEPEVRALGEYLDRDVVSLWGYDRLR